MDSYVQAIIERKCNRHPNLNKAKMVFRVGISVKIDSGMLSSGSSVSLDTKRWFYWINFSFISLKFQLDKVLTIHQLGFIPSSWGSLIERARSMPLVSEGDFITGFYFYCTASTKGEIRREDAPCNRWTPIAYVGAIPVLSGDNAHVRFMTLYLHTDQDKIFSFTRISTAMFKHLGLVTPSFWRRVRLFVLFFQMKAT